MLKEAIENVVCSQLGHFPLKQSIRMYTGWKKKKKTLPEHLQNKNPKLKESNKSSDQGNALIY